MENTLVLLCDTCYRKRAPIPHLTLYLMVCKYCDHAGFSWQSLAMKKVNYDSK